MNVTELTKRREELAGKIRSMADDFKASSEPWNADEEAEFNRLGEDYDQVVEQLKTAGRVSAICAAVEEYDNQPNNPHGVGYSYGEEPQLTGGFEWLEGSRGERVPVVKPEQSYAKALEAAGQDLNGQRDIGLGDFMASLALGARTGVERNVLAESTPAGGGVTVPTRLAAELVDLMRPQTQVIAAGARTIPLDTEKTVFATLESDPTASWRNELGAVAESEPTFGSLTFTARSLAFKVSISEELLEDSVNVRAELPRVMASVMAQEVDRVALAGSGTAPEPRGILNVSGLPTVDAGASVGPLDDYSAMLKAVELLNSRNHNGPLSSIMHTRSKAQLDGLTDTTGQPLRRPPVLEGLPMLPTTKMPIDEVDGSNTDLSSIIVGDFSNLAIGIRHGVRATVLTDTLKDNLTYTYLIRLRMDVQAFRIGAFQRIQKIAA